MEQSFASKVALVTGVNSGIGRAIALAFAEQGAKVMIAARRVADSEETVAMLAARQYSCKPMFRKRRTSRPWSLPVFANTGNSTSRSTTPASRVRPWCRPPTTINSFPARAVK